MHNDDTKQNLRTVQQYYSSTTVVQYRSDGHTNVDI